MSSGCGRGEPEKGAISVVEMCRAAGALPCDDSNSYFSRNSTRNLNFKLVPQC